VDFSFEKLPRFRLWFRWGGAGAIFYCVSLAASGIYLATPDGQSFVHGPSRAPTAVVAVKYPVFGWPLLAARQNFEHFLQYTFHVPEVCWPDNQVNEFQVRQCQDFWYRWTASSVFVLGPLLIGLLALFTLRSQVHQFYSRARRAIGERRAVFAGSVVDTQRLQFKEKRDWFAFFFGLTPQVVQLQNRELKRVYLGPGAPRPQPGQTLAVFEAGKFLGESRRVAIVFHPQVVAISGRSS
jgi:hypothetical protein